MGHYQRSVITMQWLKNIRNTCSFLLTASLICAAILLPTANSADLSAPSQESVEKKTEDDDSLHWAKSISEGSDKIFYFAEAIGGKTLKKESYDLLLGVTDVTIEKDKITFKRSDNEQLEFGIDTEHGGKFFQDWEKSKHNLETKFGAAGREFLDNIESVHVDGDRIEINRKGPAILAVDMGERKLHHAFDLRGIRFAKIAMNVESSGKHPSLKNIEGVSVILNAPGFSFPVNVKEFAKWKLPKGADIKVGVKNPVPSAVRAILFLPSVLRFHFFLPRKD